MSAIKRAAHDSEFRAVYQDPGPLYFGVGCFFAATALALFYLFDVVNGAYDYVGGPQTPRLLLILTLVLLGAGSIVSKGLVARHYQWFVPTVAFLVLNYVVWLAYDLRRHQPVSELFWALNTTVITGMLVVYGFIPLPVSRVTLISLPASILAVALAAQVPNPPHQYLARLVISLGVGNLIAYWFRRSIETRERKLFELAKENLARNIYAKELEAANRSAELANRAKTQFLANMSHEVRTPMNGILQTLEVVRSTSNPEDRVLMDRATAAGHALLKILNGILNYTKLAQGHEKLVLSEVSIRDICATVTATYGAAASIKGLALTLNVGVPPEEDRIIADEVKILEVVGNLVTNAIKFTDRGHVTVTASLRNAHEKSVLTLAVSDSGIGVDEDQAEQAFNAFYQADSGSSRRAGGTGLGLAITRELVNVMGGTISVESVPGLGSTFTAHIPVQWMKSR